MQKAKLKSRRRLEPRTAPRSARGTEEDSGQDCCDTATHLEDLAARSSGPGTRDAGPTSPTRTRYLNKKSLAETLRLFVQEQPLPRREPELISVESSLGRVTASPIFARVSVPHYHGAAMDGIAVRAEDTFGASEASPIQLSLAAASPTEPPMIR